MLYLLYRKKSLVSDAEEKVEIEDLDITVGEKGELYVTVKTTKTTHIKSGIIYNKFDKIGKIEEYEKKIGLNSDRKCNWFTDLKSLKEMTFCDSVPIPIDLVDDIISKRRWNGL